jgi:hypothetical protein
LSPSSEPHSDPASCNEGLEKTIRQNNIIMKRCACVALTAEWFDAGMRNLMPENLAADFGMEGTVES